MANARAVRNARRMARTFHGSPRAASQGLWWKIGEFTTLADTFRRQDLRRVEHALIRAKPTVCRHVPPVEALRLDHAPRHALKPVVLDLDRGVALDRRQEERPD